MGGMTYECPTCGTSDTYQYIRCYHPVCPDGRDQIERTRARLREESMQIIDKVENAASKRLSVTLGLNSGMFFRIYNRNGVCLWSGNAENETEAWRRHKIESNTPDAISVEQLTKGRYGLRIISWPI